MTRAILAPYPTTHLHNVGGSFPSDPAFRSSENRLSIQTSIMSPSRTARRKNPLRPPAPSVSPPPSPHPQTPSKKQKRPATVYDAVAGPSPRQNPHLNPRHTHTHMSNQQHHHPQAASPQPASSPHTPSLPSTATPSPPARTPRHPKRCSSAAKTRPRATKSMIFTSRTTR